MMNINNFPKVSVIIPAKNEAVFLPLILPALHVAVENYRGQVELLLLDNGSDDNTTEIAKKFNFTIFICKNIPVSELRNIGVKKATGVLIAFVDADCKVDPEWLTRCVQLMNDKKLGAVGTRAVPDFSNWTWVEKGWFTLVSGAHRPDFPKWLGTSNLIVDRSIFERIGGFDASLSTAEDVDLTEKISTYAPLFLEKEIHTIHLRESKTLKELFLRELYRGKDSYKHFLKSKKKKQLFTSVFVPPIFFLLLVFSLTYFLSIFSVFPLILTLIIPFLFILKKRVHILTTPHLFYVYPVSFVYLLARGISTCLNMIKRDH